ncbi:MAG: META domain-containing protein [Marmoricola sp.]
MHRDTSRIRSGALAGIVLVLGTLLTGCGSHESVGLSADPAAPVVEGHTYVVTGVTSGGRPRQLVKGSQIRLHFDQGRIVVTAGCNTMSGHYTLDGSRLTVDDLATTEMGCDFTLMEQDSWVSSLFAKPVQLMTGDDAALISGGVVLLLAERESAAPDLPLASTRWVIDSIVDGDVVSSVAHGAEGYLVVDGDSVTVSDGCNTGSGPVRVTGRTIRFGALVMTTRPCPSTSSPLVSAVAEVLAGTATYEVDERSLTITRGSHGLGLHAVRAVR